MWTTRKLWIVFHASSHLAHTHHFFSLKIVSSLNRRWSTKRYVSDSASRQGQFETVLVRSRGTGRDPGRDWAGRGGTGRDGFSSKDHGIVLTLVRNRSISRFTLVVRSTFQNQPPGGFPTNLLAFRPGDVTGDEESSLFDRILPSVLRLHLRIRKFEFCEIRCIETRR